MSGYLRRIFLTSTTMDSSASIQRNTLRRLKVISRTISHKTISPTINVDPPDALIDEPVTINVSGLHQHQKVTLSATLKNDGKNFLSCAHYTADANGQVNCVVQPSVGGSYTGVEPMGLFWAMVPSSKHRRATRLLKKDVTKPYDVSISVLPNHKTLATVETERDTTVLASTQVKRWYMGKGVQRIPLREGRLRGALFIPEGYGPFPAVLDMFGGSGGLFDFRGALLASRGFLALSLAYFSYEGLPSNYDDLKIHYFLEAADWLSKHPRAIHHGIGVIGVSYGAGVAYLLAAHSPVVRAVLAINGVPFSPMYDHHLNGELIEGYIPILDGDTEDGYGNNTFAFKDGDIHITPIWRQNVKILSVIGEDDKSVNPQFYRWLMTKVPPGNGDNIQSVFYPGAGHLIEPPYTPLCPASYLGDAWGKVLRWGGEPKGHAVAQEDAWKRTLEHFRKHVGNHET